MKQEEQSWRSNQSITMKLKTLKKSYCRREAFLCDNESLQGCITHEKMQKNKNCREKKLSSPAIHLSSVKYVIISPEGRPSSCLYSPFLCECVRVCFLSRLKTFLTATHTVSEQTPLIRHISERDFFPQDHQEVTQA